MARAFGASLVDIIVQINAVRLLIAEHQLTQIREAVASSSEPVLVVDAKQRTLFANEAFFQLTRRKENESPSRDEMAGLFAQPEIARRMLSTITQERRPWRGELDIDMRDGTTLPAAVRAEVVAARDGSILGFFLILSDLSETQRAASARRQLEASLAQARQVGSGEQAQQLGAREPDGLMAAILANASLAAMDIADSETTPGVATLLQELENGTKRAAALYWRIRSFS